MYYLSLDFGTSSVKAAILDENLNCLKAVKSSYELRMTCVDHVEIEPEDIINSLESCISQIREYKEGIEIICFDTFAPSVIFMNRSGNAIYPVVTHLDRRSRRESKQILNLIDKKRYQEITGILPFAGGVSATSILWVKKNRPEVFDEAFIIGHLSTYIYNYLTGEWAMDPVNASMTGLFETAKCGDWSELICEKIGISKTKLPPIKNVGTTYSKLKSSLSNKYGFINATRVYLGTQDIAAAQIGANNNLSGDVLFISGSSEMASILTNKPIIKDSHYLRCAVTPGLWQIFSITTGGFAIEWVKEQFFRDMSHSKFYDKYFEDILANKFSTKFVKYNSFLTGDRHSLQKKRGSFTGLTLDTNRDNIFCALIEGMQKPALATVATCMSVIELNKKAKITGNLVEVSKSYLDYKRKLFSMFELEINHNGPIIGNVIIIREHLNKEYKCLKGED